MVLKDSPFKFWYQCIGSYESKKWRRNKFYLSLHRLLLKAAMPSIERRHTHIAFWSTNFEMRSCTEKFIHIWYLFDAIWGRYVENKKGMSETRSHRSWSRILLVSMSQHGIFASPFWEINLEQEHRQANSSVFDDLQNVYVREWSERQGGRSLLSHLARFRCLQVKGSAQSYGWILSTHFGDIDASKKSSPHMKM
jgi:hypothetical protein